MFVQRAYGLAPPCQAGRNSRCVNSAMAAGVSDRLWTFDDVLTKIDAAKVSSKREPYKREGRMIWSIVLGVFAYLIIASAGYETAREQMSRHPDGTATPMHIVGLITLAASLYLAANSN